MSEDVVISKKQISIGTGVLFSLLIAGIGVAIKTGFNVVGGLAAVSLRQEDTNRRLGETVSTLKEINQKVDGQLERMFEIQTRQATFGERITSLEEWRKRTEKTGN